MSLPPLPERHHYMGYTSEQMQAYGQACRSVALEEAAMAPENGFKYALDGYQIADNIRSLKP